MAEKTTIARPYAEAVFALARDTKQLKEWSVLLHFAACVSIDEAMQAMISNTAINRAKLADLFIDICKDVLGDKGDNLIKILVENHRLSLLPEIAAQYEHLKAEAEKTIDAEVVSAFKVSAAQQKMIAAKLKARLGREVSLTCLIDKSLLGGVVIKAGDMVIDGSTIGQINKLSVELLG